MQILLEGRGSDLEILMQYQAQAHYFMCACLQKNYGRDVRRTPGSQHTIF